jgi:uncharacterized protein
VSKGDAEAVVSGGLAAWRRGDLEALEQFLDPAVTLRAVRPGPWDCDNRDQVMSFLRQRQERGLLDPAGEFRVEPMDESTFLVSGLGGMEGTATLVRFVGGKVVSMQQTTTGPVDSTAESAVAAVRAGDVEALARLLSDAPDLARAPVSGYGGRTLLHIVTDWPGYTPRGPELVSVLIDRGADPNHRGGDNTEGETPLHWAASSDDVDVARALLDGGADPEAPDGSIGTPLDNAVGYACWHVARLLADRGAHVDKLWHAAALGDLDRLETLLQTRPTTDEVSQAFWHACAASQRRAAERLLHAGAELNWTPDYAEGTPLDTSMGQSTRQQNVIEWLQTLGASSAQSTDEASGQG